MLNRFLFAILAVLLLYSVGRCEEPDSVYADSISLERVPLPALESKYLTEVSVWDGLPLLTFRSPGQLARIDLSTFSRFHPSSSSHVIALGAVATERCSGCVGQPCLLEIGGASPRSVLFLKDGIPFEDELTGVSDLSLISGVALRRIEVEADASSSIYGPGGSRGAVNLVSKAFEGVAPYSRVGASNGSHGFQQVELEFGRGVGESWRGYVTSDYVRGDGFTPGADFDMKTFGGDLSYLLGGMKAGVSAYRVDAKRGMPGDTSGVRPFRREEKRRLLGALYLASSTFDAKLYYREGWSQDTDSLENEVGTRTSDNAGGWVKKAFNVGRHRIVIGGTSRQRKLDAEDSLSCDVLDGGITTSAELEVLPLVWISPSVSYWYDETYGSEVSPRLSVSMAYSLGLLMFASVARGFDAPTLAELFSSASGNSELHPEHAWSYSGGFRYEQEGISATASAFLSERSDLIRTAGDTTGIHVNSGLKERVSGVRLSARGELSRLLAGANLCLISSEDTEGQYEAGSAPGISAGGYAGLHDTFRKGNLGLSFVVEAEHVGERPADKDVPLPAYSLVNLCAEVRIVDVRFFHQILNILDEEYESVPGYSMPGRTIRYGIEWEFWN
jgi:outer membrane receptor protein involved in Fe transport